MYIHTYAHTHTSSIRGDSPWALLEESGQAGDHPLSGHGGLYEVISSLLRLNYHH